MATKAPAQRGGTTTGDVPLDRLTDSLDAAQAAVKDLRRELSKGGRDMLKDLDALLRDARKNLRGTQRTLRKDLEEVQKAATGKRRTAARGTAKATTKARATSTRRPAGQTTRAARKT